MRVKTKEQARNRRHMRLRKTVSGTSETPRLSVYRTNKQIYAQIIDDVKGTTLVSESSKNLKLSNGSNIEAAEKVGASIAQKANEAGITNIVFDRGGNIYHGRVKALAEAARTAGLKF